MAEKDEPVSFECSFTKAEIEVTCKALEFFIMSGMCPDGLRGALVSTTQAFQSVRRTGSALN